MIAPGVVGIALIAVGVWSGFHYAVTGGVGLIIGFYGTSLYQYWMGRL